MKIGQNVKKSRPLPSWRFDAMRVVLMDDGDLPEK